MYDLQVALRGSPLRAIARAQWLGGFTLALMLGGCVTEGRVPRDPDVLAMHEAGPRPELPAVDGSWLDALTEASIPLHDRIEAFARDAVAAVPGTAPSFAVLPAVAYDVRRGRPWVPELGVRLGESIRSTLATRSLDSRILTDGELVERLAAADLEKRMFSNFDHTVRLAPALAVDVTVFCSLRVEHDIGRPDRTVITVDATAFETATGRSFARMRCEITDESRNNAPFFALAGRESTWLLSN